VHSEHMVSLRLTPQELNKGGEEFAGEDSG
jgi:hypothetical protein